MAETEVLLPRLQTWMPGLRLLHSYDRSNFRGDLVAGVSVAAVAIPIGIAYAQLAGSPPVVGIYSCILPPVAYALFGSSRQLIVNPDAAACTIVSATTVPLALGDPARYADLSITLTLLTGLFCIIAGIARLGVIANFLSRPILVGYLNGIAISIIVGQIGKLVGVEIPAAGVFRTVAAIFMRIGEMHGTTLLVGIGLLVGLLFIKRAAPLIPGPLVAAVVGISIIYFLRLHERGVHIIGAIPSGFPMPRIPTVSFADLGPLSMGASTIMLVSFCSMMTTARGFATKNNYQIDANRDLIALGVCDIASGLNRGFVGSGADSRTAVADAAGGKTQVASLIASATMALVLLFLTAPLGYLPSTALAAILISSSIGLFDLRSLASYYRVSKPEFRQSVAAMLGVMTVGILPGILIAVGMALLRLLLTVSKPHDALLGRIEGEEEVVNVAEESNAKTIPGLVIYRFDSPILFFNADHFRDRVRHVIREADGKVSWFLLDAESAPLLDITGAGVLESLRAELYEEGVAFNIARARGWFRVMLTRTGVAARIGDDHIFPTIVAGIRAFIAEKK